MTSQSNDRPPRGALESITPGPTAVIPADTNVDPLIFLADLIEQYGDVVRYHTKFGSCFLFVHPDHVQTILHRENYRRASLFKMMLGDGLLASDGPRWRSQRRLMQKDFLPASVAPFVAIMARETRKTIADWHVAALENKAVDITAAMTQLTLRIVVCALFSEDIDDPTLNQLCGAVTQVITDLGRISRTMFGAAVQFTPVSSAAFAAGKKVIDAICYDLINRRRNQNATQRPRDLLTLLVEAETDSGPMTDLQLRDELVTMLVGGHETTALALAWTWKLIGDHPAVAAEMHREIDSVLAGREPGVMDLQKLPYVQAVFQESMRLYPPVWSIARMANEDDVVAGYAIPRGAYVLLAPWFTHRHKSFWPDPERFDPARFTDGAAAARHRYAYFPFAGGRHQCIGMHFSMLEGVQILAQLAQQFDLHLSPGENIKPDPGITLRQNPLMSATPVARAAST